ncbi:sodium-dependent transporter [Vallitaleaceae bacterium 9-2]
MNEKRGQWGSRMGFVIAAIGSAIGLGNIWRFPYVAASNGGGAFLIPYLFALLTAGIPILILEFSIAHKIKRSAPGIFGRISKKTELLGWFQTAISFGIVIYYTAIIGWTINYVLYAINGAWGQDTESFFFNDFLNISDHPLAIGGINTKMLIALALVWLVNYIVLMGGIKSGIEKANKIFMPLLVVCLIVITIRGLTLEGATQGLDYFFRPEFSKLKDPTVWIAAYGQIFYSLSICFGIMMTYASYLPKKTDIVNNAFLTGLGNCSFSILSGIAVFSVLGYMAASQGVAVSEVSTGGIGLAFIVFPTAINALPNMNALMGALFFFCLIFAGFSSSMSILEVIVSGFSDKFESSRKKVLTLTCFVGFIFSFLFVTDAGLYFLDIIDHFINTYAIAVAGLIEIIFLSWYLNLEDVRKYANSMSDFSIGKWWNISLKYLTPILLSVMFVFNTFIDLTKGYENYDLTSLLAIGGSTLVFIVIIAIVLNRMSGASNYHTSLGKGVDLNEC